MYFQEYNSGNAQKQFNMFDFCQVIYSFAKMGVIDKENFIILVSQKLIKLIQKHG